MAAAAGNGSLAPHKVLKIPLRHIRKMGYDKMLTNLKFHFIFKDIPAE
jgi:hypothetical protein